MRFLLDVGVKFPEIVTIKSLSIMPSYKSPYDNMPDELHVALIEEYDHMSKSYNFLEGDYNLDGSEETYLAAEDNYDKICEQLLTEGFARMSDFENFTWED